MPRGGQNKKNQQIKKQHGKVFYFINNIKI